jgi:hypothetical protein
VLVELFLLQGQCFFLASTDAVLLVSTNGVLVKCCVAARTVDDLGRRDKVVGFTCLKQKTSTRDFRLGIVVTINTLSPDKFKLIVLFLLIRFLEGFDDGGPFSVLLLDVVGKVFVQPSTEQTKALW